MLQCELISLPEPGNSPADIAQAKLIGNPICACYLLPAPSRKLQAAPCVLAWCEGYRWWDADTRDENVGGTVSMVGVGVVAIALLTGAAAGPVFIMVDQMQYMSVIGRIGGGTSAANLAFSETMGLFNFEFMPNIFEQEAFKNPLGRRRVPQGLGAVSRAASSMGNLTNTSLGSQGGQEESQHGMMQSEGLMATRGQRRQVDAFCEMASQMCTG